MCFELLKRVLFFLCTRIDLVEFDCKALSVQFSRSVVSDCLQPHESQHARPPCPSLVAIYMKVKVAVSCPSVCDPMDYTFHGILQARILEWVVFPFCGDLPNPGIGLLHCRRILYKLSHKGSPALCMDLSI